MWIPTLVVANERDGETESAGGKPSCNRPNQKMYDKMRNADLTKCIEGDIHDRSGLERILATLR